MQTIVVDPELRAKLNGLDEEVEICDEAGRPVGRYVPEKLYQTMLYAAVEAACPHSKEEIERRRNETGGRTLAEIWKSLGVK